MRRWLVLPVPPEMPFPYANVYEIDFVDPLQAVGDPDSSDVFSGSDISIYWEDE